MCAILRTVHIVHLLSKSVECGHEVLSVSNQIKEAIDALRPVIYPCVIESFDQEGAVYHVNMGYINGVLYHVNLGQEGC